MAVKITAVTNTSGPRSTGVTGRIGGRRDSLAEALVASLLAIWTGGGCEKDKEEMQKEKQKEKVVWECIFSLCRGPKTTG